MLSRAWRWGDSCARRVLYMIRAAFGILAVISEVHLQRYAFGISRLTLEYLRGLTSTSMIFLRYYNMLRDSSDVCGTIYAMSHFFRAPCV